MSQEFSDLPLSNSCNADLDVPSLTKLPKKRSHKHVVKKYIPLGLHADFLKEDKLVL